MISVMRNKFGPIIIGGIVGLIAFVFIFYGIFMPGRGSGGGGPGVAGEINGETISYTEFSRALNQRVEFFKNMMGGKELTEEQLEQFHLRETVFQDLAQRKLLSQVARKEGFYPPTDQIREQILNMEVFKKDGHFDKVLYKNVLTQNNLSPTRFEDLVGQDIMENNFKSFLASLAFVAPEEVENDLKTSHDKRKVRYLYLDNESVRKTLPAEAKTADAKSVAAQPGAAKPTDPTKPDPVKTGEQNKKLDAAVASLSTEFTGLLSANASEAKVDAALKSAGLDSKTVKLKTSDWLTPKSEYIAGVGSIHSIQPELWTAKKGDPAKKYSMMGGTLIASVSDVDNYDATKTTPKEKADALARLQNQKQSELTQDIIKAWMKKASLSRNDSVVVGGKGQAMPVGADN